MKKLTISAIGCGSRARTYINLCTQFPDQWDIVAGADPIAEKVEVVKKASSNENFRSFNSADAFLAEPQMSDVLIIGTQDNYHFEPAKKALKLGYHLLLEKPACQNVDEVMELAEIAKKYNRKVVLCFVLRYTPIYKKVKEILESGKLGEIISLRASEGVGAFHQAHSFVRGHWAKSGDSTPMIIAKCSHDLDIISWLMDQPCRRVSSFGSLSYFTEKNRPEGSPDNCLDGDAEHLENCDYCAQKYLSEPLNGWLKMVYPDPDNMDDKEKVYEWLKNSPWSRNVFSCDNDVVDHQVVNMEFENGATAALTMTAFDLGRTIEIYGSKASLRAGDAVKSHFDKDIVIRHHISGELENIEIELPDNEGYAGHGGGDYGLISELHSMISTDNNAAATIQKSVESHKIGFAAEASRLANGFPVELLK